MGTTPRKPAPSSTVRIPIPKLSSEREAEALKLQAQETLDRELMKQRRLENFRSPEELIEEHYKQTGRKLSARGATLLLEALSRDGVSPREYLRSRFEAISKGMDSAQALRQLEEANRRNAGAAQRGLGTVYIDPAYARAPGYTMSYTAEPSTFGTTKAPTEKEVAEAELASYLGVEPAKLYEIEV